MARSKTEHELDAWLNQHGYGGAHSKRGGRNASAVMHSGPRTFKLVERHLPTDVGGRIDVTIIETITPQDGGVVVDRHVKGTQEGRRVDDRFRKFYPDVSMDKAVSYRQRMGYSEVTSGAHARIGHQEPTRNGRAHAVRKQSVAATIAAIRAKGANVKFQDGEWRVNVPGSSEATAYYTNDAGDAIVTAKSMMARARRLTLLRA